MPACGADFQLAGDALLIQGAGQQPGVGGVYQFVPGSQEDGGRWKAFHMIRDFKFGLYRFLNRAAVEADGFC